MKFLLCLLVLFSADICFADSGDKLVASWHADGDPIDKLTGIDTNQFPVVNGLTLKDGTVEGELRVKLADMKTGRDERDEHMLSAEYLDTAKFPEAVIKLDAVKTSKAQFEWTGKLTLKGVTKPVKGFATVDGKAIKAWFTVDLAAWRDVIKKPRRLGVGIKDDVVITVVSQ